MMFLFSLFIFTFESLRINLLNVSYVTFMFYGCLGNSFLKKNKCLEM